MIDDPIIQSSVSRVALRAERQENVGQLVATFVDPGISVQLENDNNQIIYGRRGTGKTHVLKVVESHVSAFPDRLAIYIDMRTLGSNSVFADEGRPLHVRATSLLKDVLAEIENVLLEWVTNPETVLPGNALESIDALTTAITRTAMVDVTATAEEQQSSEQRAGSGSSVKLSARPEVAAQGTNEAAATESERITRTGSEISPIYFQELNQAMRDVLASAGISRLLVLLDEWTAIPIDLQPLLAEFLKRAFFTIPQVTLKIASLEYRSDFSIPQTNNNVIGFELGADISSVIELDDYFVYDRNTDKTVEMFSELLYRHISAEADALPSEPVGEAQLGMDRERGYLADRHGVNNAAQLVRRLFSSPDAFKELVRAGEGVARDFINIFSSAFFSSVRRDRASIDMRGVQEAAREWYEKDKAPNVDEQQEAFLRNIIENVIGTRRARSFLLEKQYEKDSMILSLFDFRLLHLVRRGYADKDTPGLRYNIYTLDYGTYVDLLGTQRAPADDFTESLTNTQEETVVPFDDNRSIRRIILRPDQLRGNGGTLAAN